jgi:UDP-GlcNAc:undecaprenyl-phosphate GlcNAc-1-phosphate transferase
MLLPLLAGVLVVHWQTHRLDVTGRLLSHGLDRRGGELGGIVSGAIGMLLLGILDDKYELRAVTKLAGQLAVALLVAAAGVRITLFVHNLVFSYFITILWILTVTNAFNFMDNMNGLCVGLAAIGSWNFAVIAGVQGQYLAGVMGLLMCGALLGFLPHNFPRASAFLGDAGSHLAGYLLAVMAILPHFYNRLYPHHAAVLIPLLVLAVPLGDLGWVVCLRWREGQPVYVGDHNHLSHRLVKMGHSQRRSVLEIWLLAVVLGALAVFLVLF